MLATFLILACATGATLAQGFRVYVLFPTSLVVAVLMVMVSLQQGYEPLRAFLVTGATLTFIQVGYFVGLLPRAMPTLTGALSSERHRARGQARQSWVARRR
jgi:cytochrome bd-type quinol oxidase subunit 2